MRQTLEEATFQLRQHLWNAQTRLVFRDVLRMNRAEDSAACSAPPDILTVPAWCEFAGFAAGHELREYLALDHRIFTIREQWFLPPHAPRRVGFHEHG